MTSDKKQIRLKEIVSPAFWEVHQQVREGKVKEIVLKGGRGSTKSSYAGIELILRLLEQKECHAVVLRKVAGTLRTSVFSQICWAISALGKNDKFKSTVSPMEITCIETGQKILFFGLDDAGKLKSVKLPFGYIGVVWFEELDQFAGEEEIRNVEQSLFRGGEYSLCIKSFNPPISARNWANRWVLQKKEGRLVHHSTYLTTPKKWLGERFLQDAEHLKQTNPKKYRHEYLGEAVGTGASIFGNLRIEPIPQDKKKQFERLLHGVDWGWYPDPWAYNGCSYDAARNTLYIYDELTRVRTTNQQTAQLLKQRGVCANKQCEESLVADSAEPKSCGDYRVEGLPCQKAEKGPGSLVAGMKWLQGLTCIWIDAEKCPDTAKEFLEYEYQQDRQSGEVMEGYPDCNNHHIDAVRYATSKIWKRRGQ